jgi:activator of HSP90 ATPase
VKIIKQEYKIKAPVASVWLALVTPSEIGKWGAGPAVMDDKVGTQLSLWGGDVWGKNVEVVPNQKLVQEWYGGDWPQPSYVMFTLEEKNGVTTVKLHQENVPEKEYEAIKDGWKRYYLGEIKKYLEKLTT